MPAFSSFDTRKYRTVSARDGYGLWSPSYEDTVKEDMDLWLLDQVRTVEWAATRRAADLGCGTGRTGSWLAARGVRRIDGIDLTPEMLEQARRRGVFQALAVADVCASGLEAHAYDLVTTSLVDEHLRDLQPLYRESARIACSGAAHVVVGFHPFFIMKVGMPTHFDGPDGQPIAIETYVHLFSDHVRGRAGGGLVARRDARAGDRRALDRGEASLGRSPRRADQLPGRVAARLDP